MPALEAVDVRGIKAIDAIGASTGPEAAIVVRIVCSTHRLPSTVHRPIRTSYAQKEVRLERAVDVKWLHAVVGGAPFPEVSYRLGVSDSARVLSDRIDVAEWIVCGVRVQVHPTPKLTGSFAVHRPVSAS